MSYCLNPSCRRQKNSDDVQVCQSCSLPLLLKERYRAIEPIGQGGFGRTFLAVDEDMPSKPCCVIKQFFYQGHKDFNKAEELFRQEAEQLEKLGKNNPQIPELFAHFEIGSGLYLVQEFINGQDLLQELKDQGAFDETKIRQLLNDVLPVLQFIHSQRVIHRDIKPENIIRRQADNKLVLVDFGVSKFATETALGRTGTIIGTQGYAALEQSRGKAEFASDLYSLGATCFHLLTDKHPSDVFFPYGDWEKYLKINLNQSGITDALKRVLTKLLQPDISQRYQSPEEVLQDLNLDLAQATTEPPLVFPASAPKPCPQSWQCVNTFTGHTWDVFTVAISPDSQTIASGATDHQIKIWDLHTGKLRYTRTHSILGQHSGDVYSIAFSPSGETLVSAGWGSSSRHQSNTTQKTIQLWHLSTMEVLRTFSGHLGSVRSVAISPDGQILASGGGDKTIKLWNLHTGELLNTLSEHSKWVSSVAISPDGQILASGGGDKTIKLWNLHTGELLNTLSEHSESVNSVTISPDGQILASGSGDKTIKLWNLHTGELLNTLSEHSESVNSVTISPDGQIIASGSRDKTIKIWHISTGESLCTLNEHSKSVYSVAFSPDGQIIASSSEDTTIKIWRLSS
ncbi:MAG: serine/threonine protein kinase [Aphanothece sp. CMT-3BRIN-NPC111]|jgi:WD40 repeat protein|nr:serine/threonine protein kinase [Aphanothece sp. CMT-3BRIN-NPC111]